MYIRLYIQIDPYSHVYIYLQVHCTYICKYLYIDMCIYSISIHFISCQYYYHDCYFLLFNFIPQVIYELLQVSQPEPPPPLPIDQYLYSAGNFELEEVLEHSSMLTTFYVYLYICISGQKIQF
jgi:hypothetical protein